MLHTRLQVLGQIDPNSAVDVDSNDSSDAAPSSESSTQTSSAQNRRNNNSSRQPLRSLQAMKELSTSELQSEALQNSKAAVSALGKTVQVSASSLTDYAKSAQVNNVIHAFVQR